MDILKVGHIIRGLRKEKGISQGALAKKAVIDRTTVARIENGKFKSSSLETLEKIAAVLDSDLKSLLSKSESGNKAFGYHGHINHVEFVLDCSAAGFRIISLFPRRKEVFFGKIELQPQKTIPSAKLPHPEQIYLHSVDSKILVIYESKEFLLKPGDCFVFSGSREYELYNPGPVKVATSLFITYPSFTSLY